MLAPHELKGKSFSKKLNGYNPSEVEDFIEFVIEKYTDLYRENNELERKLKIVVTNFDEIRDEEEAIRSTLIKSQKLGEKIIRDANERAEIITSSIKERCDKIIATFREQIRTEKEEMWSIRTRVIEFKKDLFSVYTNHIEEIQAISVNEIEDIVLPDEREIIGKIFNDVRNTIQNEVNTEAMTSNDEELNPKTKTVDEEADEVLEAIKNSGMTDRLSHKEDVKKANDDDSDYIDELENLQLTDNDINSDTKPFSLFNEEE